MIFLLSVLVLQANMLCFPDWLIFSFHLCVWLFAEMHIATKRVREPGRVKSLNMLRFDLGIHGVPIDMVSLVVELCGIFCRLQMWSRLQMWILVLAPLHELKSPKIRFWVGSVVQFLFEYVILLPVLRYKLEDIEKKRKTRQMRDSKYERDFTNSYLVKEFLGYPELVTSYTVKKNGNGKNERKSCRRKNKRRRKGRSPSRSRHSSQTDD